MASVCAFLSHSPREPYCRFGILMPPNAAHGYPWRSATAALMARTGSLDVESRRNLSDGRSGHCRSIRDYDLGPFVRHIILTSRRSRDREVGMFDGFLAKRPSRPPCLTSVPPATSSRSG